MLTAVRAVDDIIYLAQSIVCVVAIESLDRPPLIVRCTYSSLLCLNKALHRRRRRCRHRELKRDV